MPPLSCQLSPPGARALVADAFNAVEDSGPWVAGGADDGLSGKKRRRSGRRGGAGGLQQQQPLLQQLPLTLPPSADAVAAAFEAVRTLPPSWLALAMSLLADLPADVAPLVIARSMVRRGKGGRQPGPDPHQDASLTPADAARIVSNRELAARAKFKKKVADEAQKVRRLLPSMEQAPDQAASPSSLYCLAAVAAGMLEEHPDAAADGGEQAQADIAGTGPATDQQQGAGSDGGADSSAVRSTSQQQQQQQQDQQQDQQQGTGADGGANSTAVCDVPQQQQQQQQGACADGSADSSAVHGAAQQQQQQQQQADDDDGGIGRKRRSSSSSTVQCCTHADEGTALVSSAGRPTRALPLGPNPPSCSNSSAATSGAGAAELPPSPPVRVPARLSEPVEQACVQPRHLVHGIRAAQVLLRSKVCDAAAAANAVDSLTNLLSRARAVPGDGGLGREVRQSVATLVGLLAERHHGELRCCALAALARLAAASNEHADAVVDAGGVEALRSSAHCWPAELAAAAGDTLRALQLHQALRAKRAQGAQHGAGPGNDWLLASGGAAV